MKIAIIGDTHIGCSDYSDRRTSDFSVKFVEVMQYVMKNDIQAVVLLGDVFDSTAYRRSVDSFAAHLHEIAKTLVELKTRNIPVLCILGNHEFGRGREGGEIRILSDLGFVRLLDDECISMDGVRLCGISWKSDPVQFRAALSKLEDGLAPDSILLMHQFVSGGKVIPPRIVTVDKSELQEWKKVFVGHHHVHESFDNICIPGSLEIHNALEIASHKTKGFVIYDSATNAEEFVPISPSRPLKYVQLVVDGLNVPQAERSLKEWVQANAESHALLIVKLDGRLDSGRGSEINLLEARQLSAQRGCLAISIINAIEDPVRPASEIRSAMSVDDFMKKWFKTDSEKALVYFEKFRDLGDDFIDEIKDQIIERLK